METEKILEALATGDKIMAQEYLALSTNAMNLHYFTPKAQEVWDALVKLGETHEEVRSNLYAMGYSGRCNNSTNCPVANYIMNRVLVENFGISASGFRVAKSRADIHPVPIPIAQFIVRFDNRMYPELEDT